MEEEGVNISLKPPLAYTAQRREGEPSDLEQLRAWQQERTERRLRDEYESSLRRLSKVIQASVDAPARIVDVHVQGNTRARSSFLGYIINPHLKDSSSIFENSPESPLRPSGSETLEDVLRRVHRMSNVLERSDIFHKVSVALERSRSPLAGPNDVDVIFNVRDRPRMFLKGSTETGNGEGSATATARVRNVFGGAETLEGSVSYGTQTRQAFQVRLEAPVTPTLRTRAEISAFKFERDQTFFASSNEGVIGAKAAIRRPTPLGLQELSYELSNRRIKNLAPTASISVREAAGETVKSAITHTLIRDTRDGTIISPVGSFLKWTSQVAGVGGGDASFVKTEIETHISRPLSFISGTTASLGIRSGLLVPSVGRKSLLSDRFHLGGPTSVRMFKQNGLGLKDGVDSLGGEVFWSAGLSFISDLPWRPHWPLKSQVFFNAGRLDMLDRYRANNAAPLREFLVRPSVSAGVGFIYRFDPIRLEVNFGFPLVAAKSDSYRKGVQVGIGLEFL